MKFSVGVKIRLMYLFIFKLNDTKYCEVQYEAFNHNKHTFDWYVKLPWMRKMTKLKIKKENKVVI